MSEQQLIKEFLSKFIVPNFYKPEDFGIEEWSEDKMDRFKDYLTDVSELHYAIYSHMRVAINEFEEQEEITKEISAKYKPVPEPNKKTFLQYWINNKTITEMCGSCGGEKAGENVFDEVKVCENCYNYHTEAFPDSMEEECICTGCEKNTKFYYTDCGGEEGVNLCWKCF